MGAIIKIGLVLLVVSGLFAGGFGFRGDSTEHLIGGTAGVIVSVIAAFVLIRILFSFLGCLVSLIVPIALIALILFATGSLDKVQDKVSGMINSDDGILTQPAQEPIATSPVSLPAKENNELPITQQIKQQIQQSQQQQQQPQPQQQQQLPSYFAP